MRYFYRTLFILFLFGCGDKSETIPLYSLFYQQWSINYESEFYAQNAIDENAHIHATNILERYTGRGVKVAIIDDGFDISHPEIRDKIIVSLGISSNGEVLDDATPDTSSDFHGTAVSGIVASNNDGKGVRGVAGGVELILIKIPTQLYSDAVGVSAFTEAMKYGADVICCSWGTGDVSDIVKAKIEEVAQDGRGSKGTLIVFASGNENAEMLNDESAIASVLGVGATSSENLRTGYSNFGASLDLVAPGGYMHGITTIDPLGDAGASIDEYIRFDELRDGLEVAFIGTSASAPITSGVIALLLEAHPELRREEIFEMLKSSSDKIGLNLPYIDEMISTASNYPEISGILGTSLNAQIAVRLSSKESNSTYGPYSISLVGDNSWSSIATDYLVDGNYTIEVLSSDDETMVLASDDNFEIGDDKEELKDTSKQRNNYYGYGKVNVQKLFDLIY